MYLGALANGNNGYARRKAKQSVVSGACGGPANALPNAWTRAKWPVGSVPTALPREKWEVYKARLASYGYPPQISRFWFECAAGFPLYWAWRIEQQVAKLVPTAEETAEAFVEEVKKIAPPAPVEKPTVVTPPDSRLAPPPPMPPVRGTLPVDSQLYAPPPPAAVSAAFPLQERYKRLWLERQAIAATDAMPADAAPTTEKKPGAGIGMALAAGAAGLLAMVAGG